MCLDNLTLTGLLMTRPYIAMLILFSRKRAAPVPQEVLVLECSEQEPYCYGT